MKYPLLCLILFCSLGCEEKQENEWPQSFFNKEVLLEVKLDEAPWAKFSGDVSGDGVPEILVGFHGSEKLVAFSNDSNHEQVLLQGLRFRTDGHVHDLDSDGNPDMIMLTDSGLTVFYGPNWRAETVTIERFHDVEVADLDADGNPELVVRNQTAFGNDSGDITIYSRSDPGTPWESQSLALDEGEGFEVADIDADADLDIVANGVWFENDSGSQWRRHIFASDWSWPHVKIAVQDIDADGRVDIVLAPSEPESGSYRIAWYRAPENRREYWLESTIVDPIETVIHSLRAGDVDLDGDVDIIYAEMHQGEDPDEIVFMENVDQGSAWRKRTIDDIGSHNILLLDVDGDLDLDIVGANWDGPNQDVLLWRNQLCEAPWSSWHRHVIDEVRPGQAVFITGGDVNSDSFPDLATGKFIYLNPGNSNNAWQRLAIDKSLVDIIQLLDFDSDEDLDLLAIGEREGLRYFQLFENDGSAGFDLVSKSHPVSGDFLQGVALGRFNDEKESVALSWHGAGFGIELLDLGSDGKSELSLELISDFSQDEALSAGDIDGDSDLDLFLGTTWLRNDGDFWTRFKVDNTAAPPDRNLLVDIDQDGDLDAVVGFQAISEVGDLVWYEAPEDVEGLWERHLVARIVGPMSVDVGDIDGDGDLDIVSGEHNLDDPESAVLWAFENVDGTGKQWRGHHIYKGDEHHDGSKMLDVDLDGDLDIVSIGWGHNLVVWYENRMPACATAL